MKKNFDLYKTAQVLLASTSLMLAMSAHAYTWELDDISTSTKYTVEPHFFYIGKGAQWQNIQFSSDYSTESDTTLLVKYDDKLIYNTTLSGDGQVKFDIPASQSGFHRLDFIIQQYAKPTTLNQTKETFCTEDIDHLTYLSNSQLDFTPIRNEYRLKDLPDALYNPQARRPTPFVGILKYNRKEIIEASMLARLASSWTSITPVEWVDSGQTNLDPETNFIIEVIRSAAPLKGGALVQIAKPVEGVPTLSITYHTQQDLTSAVNGLINSSYVQQLSTGNAVFPNTISNPTWAQFKKIDTLADLGIQDFRLNHAEKNLFLDFPAVWQPTDILQGQIALRIQSGLLQGSNITAWIDGGLAGSMKTADLASDPVNRQFNIFAKAISNTTNFSLKLENSVIANSQCLPNAHGSLWIDTAKSTVKLPHKLKNGVAAISMTLATTPTIAVDGQSGALNIAIVLGQTAKKMLLTQAPMPLNLVRYSPSAPQSVNVRVNKDIYQQQVLMHQDIIYAPAAQNGFIVSYNNNRFDVITDSQGGAQTFMHLWEKIQHKIPNNVTKMLVSENGNIYVLQKLIVGNQKAPLVQQSSFFLLVVIISAIMIIIIFLWYWLRRNNEKTDTN
ncbi:MULTISPECIES: hypothetical protein [Acinetobacter calcoaceticus/baumannii complex]|nr:MULTISPECIES: hypothetical protein [Acinetobacter calcoaceticus/baumannii complex]MDU6284753.1 hypothetical protein [Acinetobacter sp.]EXB01460.1 hypothetical protein J507_0413 [Acinetobacter sp. 1295259]MCG9485629.1 hypothetical protein [Acinetobacter pittii]OTM70001.1 hypothetical protein B9X97_19505 [Acinetobacter pittii]RSO78729.1 hypothetical protein EA754_03780 [Acinetobacter pittii]